MKKIKPSSRPALERLTAQRLVRAARKFLRDQDLEMSPVDATGWDAAVAALETDKNLAALRRHRKQRRLKAFAIVYARVLTMDNAAERPALLEACASRHKIELKGRVTERGILLRAALGYKPFKSIARKKERQYISTFSRAIDYLTSQNISPEMVADMKATPGNSIRAWAKAAASARHEPTTSVAKKSHDVRLRKLGLDERPIQRILLWGKCLGADKVRLDDYQIVGKGGKLAHAFWKETKRAAEKYRISGTKRHEPTKRGW